MIDEGQIWSNENTDKLEIRISNFETIKEKAN
jgi:hypothetical protein